MTFFILAGMEGIRGYYEAADWRLAVVGIISVSPCRSSGRFVVRGRLSYGGWLLAFSGAYVLLGGSGGTADAGLLTITYVYQKAQFLEYGTASAISISLLPVMLAVMGAFYFAEANRMSQASRNSRVASTSRFVASATAVFVGGVLPGFVDGVRHLQDQP